MSGLDPNDPTVRSAVFGKQVEEFLNTDVGKYLVQQAEHEAAEAIEALKTTWPWRTRRIRELQNRIWVAEHFQKWLGDAIVAGQQSMKFLEGDE